MGIPRHAGPDRHRKREPQEQAIHRNPLLCHTGQLRLPGPRCAPRLRRADEVPADRMRDAPASGRSSLVPRHHHGNRALQPTSPLKVRSPPAQNRPALTGAGFLPEAGQPRGRVPSRCLPDHAPRLLDGEAVTVLSSSCPTMTATVGPRSWCHPRERTGMVAHPVPGDPVQQVRCRGGSPTRACPRRTRLTSSTLEARD